MLVANLSHRARAGLIVSLLMLASQAWAGSVRIETTDGETHARWSDRKRHMELWLEGKVTLKPDETGVESLSQDGFLKIMLPKKERKLAQRIEIL